MKPWQSRRGPALHQSLSRMSCRISISSIGWRRDAGMRRESSAPRCARKVCWRCWKGMEPQTTISFERRGLTLGLAGVSMRPYHRASLARPKGEERRSAHQPRSQEKFVSSHERGFSAAQVVWPIHPCVNSCKTPDSTGSFVTVNLIRLDCWIRTQPNAAL